MTGKSVDVNLDNIKVDINSDSSITADINNTSNTDLTANLDSKSNINFDTSKIRTELVLPEPIVSQNSSDIGLDIRPMVMDFCFKFEFGKLPPTCIRRPYHHHFGITLFGIEVLGFSLSGDSQIMIDEVQKRPQVSWGDVEAGSERSGRHMEPHAEPGELRIRLGP